MVKASEGFQYFLSITFPHWNYKKNRLEKRTKGEKERKGKGESEREKEKEKRKGDVQNLDFLKPMSGNKSIRARERLFSYLFFTTIFTA